MNYLCLHVSPAFIVSVDELVIETSKSTSEYIDTSLMLHKVSLCYNKQYAVFSYIYTHECISIYMSIHLGG